MSNKPFEVRATRRGYYGGKLRNPGDVFVLSNTNAFSRQWMASVSGSPTPAPAPNPKDEAKVETPIVEGGNGGGGDTPLTIQEAIMLLDPADDAHWTNAGKPDCRVLTELTGSQVTKAELAEIAPDLTRDKHGEYVASLSKDAEGANG